MTSNAPNLQPPTFNDAKPLASISLDLDDKWSYMKTYGQGGWENYPSYFETLIPYVLDILDSLNLTITFFVVGQDIIMPENAHFLKLVAQHGHEVANHSFNHEPWLHLYSKNKIEDEILRTENHIVRLTGQKPVGFRGPGYNWSMDLFEILAKYDYIYDTSTLPTYIGPLARAYYFRNPNLTTEAKNKRRQILGGFREGRRPVRPYFWKLNSDLRLLEIPVTTIPVIRTPFHLSYLLFLSRYSSSLMTLYLQIAIQLCILTKVQPSFVIHPTDLLGNDQVPDMNFFPGMNLPSDYKIQIFNKVIKRLSKYFTLLDMRTHAESILNGEKTVDKTLKNRLR